MPVTPPDATATTCRIATVGWRSGQEHVVAVWFALVDSSIYAASRHGLEGDWLRNAVAAGRASVRQGRAEWAGSARVVVDPAEVHAVLDAFSAKYAKHPAIIRAWRADPPVFVAIDLDAS